MARNVLQPPPLITRENAMMHHLELIRHARLNKNNCLVYQLRSSLEMLRQAKLTWFTEAFEEFGLSLEDVNTKILIRNTAINVATANNTLVFDERLFWLQQLYTLSEKISHEIIPLPAYIDLYDV